MGGGGMKGGQAVGATNEDGTAVATDPIKSEDVMASVLKGLGVTVKYIPHLHTKMMIADGVRAYVGSENLSSTSLDHNREVGVVLTDPSSIAPLVATFDKDYAIGTDF